VPTVDVVLRGMAVTSTEGNFAPCAVYLVRGTDSGGRDRVIVYDFGHVGRRLKLTASLGRHGVTPDQVDTVVVSHAHWDHLQNVDVFGRAEILVHADELAYAADPHPHDHATPSWSAALLDRSRTRTVTDDEEILPGVRVLHLPGHTPGSIGLAVDTPHGVGVLSGDAIASGPDAAAGMCPNVFWDPDTADASNRRITELADIVYPGHDRPFRLAGTDVDYLTAIRPITVTVSGLPAAEVTVADRVRTGKRTLLATAADRAAAAPIDPAAP
jgi:N-acyl homoserine lactone hydrolase